MLSNKFSKGYNNAQAIKRCLCGFTPFEKKPLDSASSLTGFTLLELAIVIIIIGILAGFAIPRYDKAVENSRLSEAKSMLGSIRDALMRYAAENVAYPTNMNQLDINVNNGTYFNFALLGGIYNDSTNDNIAKATRNGFRVSGGYYRYYYINITENGDFRGGADGPGGYPTGADQSATPQL